MSAVQDVNMLPSLLNFDPVVVHRLRRMRQVKRPARPVDIFKRWDNCLRSEMDDQFCLRRNKYVTRLSLYYWLQSSEKTCEQCASEHESEWTPSQKPYIVMMKANPMSRGGLDFARVAIGIGVEIACFGAQLKTRFKDKVAQVAPGAESIKSTHAQEGAENDVDQDEAYQEYLKKGAHAARRSPAARGQNCADEHGAHADHGPEILSFDELYKAHEELLNKLDEVAAEPEQIYTGYETLYTGLPTDEYTGPVVEMTSEEDLYTGHEDLFCDSEGHGAAPQPIYTGYETVALTEEAMIYTEEVRSIPSDFSHFAKDHHFWNDSDENYEEKGINERHAPDYLEPTENMQNKLDGSKHTEPSVLVGNRKKRGATKVSAGKSLTGSSNQRPVASGQKAQPRTARKSSYLQSA